MTSNKNKETRRHNTKKTRKLRIPRSKYMKRSGLSKKKQPINVPVRYVPTTLTRKDKSKQIIELKKSRDAYRSETKPERKYITRKKVASFKSKTSPHILNARKMYKIHNIRPSRELAKATKCKLSALKKVVEKGKGAYFSSGSRPNQTAHSWGYARLASAITGGKASAVDLHILEKKCKPTSKALKLARANYTKKYKKGMRKVKSVAI